MKIGIFGGTFNPIHCGHLRAAEEVRDEFDLGTVFFIPSGNPPLKRKDLADAEHRYTMVKIATGSNPFFEVLEIECARAGKSYTVNTLEYLQNNYSVAEFYFILGMDAFLDIPRWREPEKILSLTNFIVLSRPGMSFSDLSHSPYLMMKKTQLARLDRSEIAAGRTVLESGKEVFLTKVTPIGISSTHIRNSLKKGRSIKYLLPAEVESYIISNKLYMQKGAW